MTAPRLGPYELVRELGRGGMGVVYEARHPELPRRLALKLIASGGLDADGLERFAREASLLARVRHPGVLAIHALGRTDDGRPYLVTDLIEGPSLGEVARSPLEPRRAATIVRTLAGAVEAIHRQGILHRDLKPENVLLRDDDTPVLLDFGLAREVDGQALTRTGAVVGTPAYMSPEQASGESPAKLDARTDVYGLGAILFELLAGRAPFDGSPLEIVTAVLTREPTWPSRERPGVPAPLEAVLRKAMARERGERYPNASALADDLGRFLEGQRVEATPRRSLRLPALVAGVIVLAGVAAVALAPGAGPPPPPPPPPPRAAPPPPPPPADAGALDQGSPLARARALLAAGDALRLGPARRRALHSLRAPPGSGGYMHLRFASERHLLLSGALHAVHVIDIGAARPEPAPLFRTTGSAVALALGPVVKGRRAVVVAGARCVHAGFFEVSGERPREVPDAQVIRDVVSTPLSGNGNVIALAVSPDGALGAVGGDFAAIEVFPLELGARPSLTIPADERAVHGVAFLGDGRRLVYSLASREDKGKVVLFDLASGARLQELDVLATPKVMAVAPDGASFASGRTGLGPLGHLAGDALELEELDRQPPGFAFIDVAFLPRQGRRLLVAAGMSEARGRDDRGEVELWDFDRGGTQVLRAIELDSGASSADLSPDGSLLAVARRDGTVELWLAGD